MEVPAEVDLDTEEEVVEDEAGHFKEGLDQMEQEDPTTTERCLILKKKQKPTHFPSLKKCFK